MTPLKTLFSRIGRPWSRPPLTLLDGRRVDGRFWLALDRFASSGHPSGETDLCRLMRRHGSDKGHCWHNYTPLYSALLEHRRTSIRNVFELGIGSNDETVPSNMGASGVPGASLRAWRDYFPAAAIYAADIDRAILVEEDRIRSFWVDQRDPVSIDAMWREIGNISFDLMIDDGLHEFESNATFMRGSIDRLASGGLYIIEDLLLTPANIRDFRDLLASTPGDYAIVSRPHPANVFDNCIAIKEIAAD